jgi:hypothetical protein
MPIPIPFSGGDEWAFHLGDTLRKIFPKKSLGPAFVQGTNDSSGLELPKEPPPKKKMFLSYERRNAALAIKRKEQELAVIAYVKRRAEKDALLELQKSSRPPEMPPRIPFGYEDMGAELDDSFDGIRSEQLTRERNQLLQDLWDLEGRKAKLDALRLPRPESLKRFADAIAVAQREPPSDWTRLDATNGLWETLVDHTKSLVVKLPKPTSDRAKPKSTGFIAKASRTLGLGKARARKSSSPRMIANFSGQTGSRTLGVAEKDRIAEVSAEYKKAQAKANEIFKGLAHYTDSQVKMQDLPVRMGEMLIKVRRLHAETSRDIKLAHVDAYDWRQKLTGTEDPTLDDARKKAIERQVVRFFQERLCHQAVDGMSQKKKFDASGKPIMKGILVESRGDLNSLVERILLSHAGDKRALRFSSDDPVVQMAETLSPDGLRQAREQLARIGRYLKRLTSGASNSGNSASSTHAESGAESSHGQGPTSERDLDAAERSLGDTSGLPPSNYGSSNIDLHVNAEAGPSGGGFDSAAGVGL